MGAPSLACTASFTFLVPLRAGGSTNPRVLAPEFSADGGDGYIARVWVVDEVLLSGRDGCTVFCVTRKEYLDKRRRSSDGRLDLADELLDLVRHTRETVSERRRWLKYRNYLP